MGEAFVPQQQESRGSDPLSRSAPATAAMAANDAGCLLRHLDAPGDRSGGVWGAWASHQDRLAREWQAELQMEQDRVDRAFGSSIHTLYEED